MGGTPVFAGTRVPVQTFLDYLEGGETINDFLEGFPTVSREQVIAFFKEAKDRMVEALLWKFFWTNSLIVVQQLKIRAKK